MVFFLFFYLILKKKKKKKKKRRRKKEDLRRIYFTLVRFFHQLRYAESVFLSVSIVKIRDTHERILQINSSAVSH